MHIDVQEVPTLLYLRNLQEKTEKKKHQQQQKPKQENKEVKC